MVDEKKIEDTKNILFSLFDKIVKDNTVIVTDVRLCFLLISSTDYKCRYHEKEVHFEDTQFFKDLSFIQKPFAKTKLRNFIVDLLYRLANENSIGKSNVNVLMSVNDKKELVLVLRNATAPIKNLSIEDIVN